VFTLQKKQGFFDFPMSKKDGFRKKMRFSKKKNIDFPKIRFPLKKKHRFPKDLPKIPIDFPWFSPMVFRCFRFEDSQVKPLRSTPLHSAPLGRPQGVGHLEPVVIGQLQPGDNRLSWAIRSRSFAIFEDKHWEKIGKNGGFMSFNVIGP
jgi:hypothetical protein